MKKHPFVLMADDDGDDREIFKEVVHRIDETIHVETVEDGSQLLEKLSHLLLLPDYIFLDLNMPCRTGHECLEDIRSNEQLDLTPVIIYSTSTWKEDIETTYRKGANLYIRKPNAIHMIEALLRRVFAIDWTLYFPRPLKELYYMEY
jgi:CheY-like chemotaxis protein